MVGFNTSKTGPADACLHPIGSRRRRNRFGL